MHCVHCEPNTHQFLVPFQNAFHNRKLLAFAAKFLLSDCFIPHKQMSLTLVVGELLFSETFQSEYLPHDLFGRVIITHGCLFCFKIVTLFTPSRSLVFLLDSPNCINLIIIKHIKNIGVIAAHSIHSINVKMLTCVECFKNEVVFTIRFLWGCLNKELQHNGHF